MTIKGPSCNRFHIFYNKLERFYIIFMRVITYICVWYTVEALYDTVLFDWN